MRWEVWIESVNWRITQKDLKFKLQEAFFFLSCNITESFFSALSRLNFLANLKGCSSHEIKRCLLLGRKAMTNLDSILKSNHFGDKGLPSQNYGFSSSHIWIGELDHKERWALKNWCLWTVVLEKTLESPLDCKEIKPVNPKGNQPWIFIQGNDWWSHYHQSDADAEGLMLKDWCWSWSSNTLTTWCEELTHWQRHWCWER